MPKFYVHIAEVWHHTVLIEAENAQVAIEFASVSDESVMTEYSHTLDRDLWEVETVPESEREA